MHAEKKKTAAYKIISDSSGGRTVQFFCDASGMLLYTAEPVRAESEEDALRTAWKSGGKRHFNLCHRCGRWVSTVMYNADTLECVDCSPWESAPRYCKACGVKVAFGDVYCHGCGAELRYGGERVDR